MVQISVVGMAAWLEFIVGAIILTIPNVPCRLLFGDELVGSGMPLGRFAGIALVSLGITCLSAMGESRRSAILGLSAFNVGVAVLLSWVGVATTLRGLLLWPAVMLHAIIAAALLTQLLTHSHRTSAVR